MVYVWEAVDAMGYESDRYADVVLASFSAQGYCHHATLSEIGPRDLADIPTLYVASGRFKPGTVSRFKGRSFHNLYDIIDLPFDFDLTTYTGRTDEEIWAQPYDETEKQIDALAEDVLEAMSAIRLPPFTISNTGYGVLARVRVGAPFRTRIEDLRNLQSHYVESINRFYGSGFCDKQVGDAGTRLTRVVGSWNEKADTPREVRVLYQGEELFDPTGIPIVRRPVASEPLPAEHPLSDDTKALLVASLAAAWEDGYRHHLALGAAGMMAKSGVPERDALDVVREASIEDSEYKDRERAVYTTYDAVKRGRPVAGYSQLLSAGTGDSAGTLAQTWSAGLEDHIRSAPAGPGSIRGLLGRRLQPSDGAEDRPAPPSEVALAPLGPEDDERHPDHLLQPVREGLPRVCLSGWWGDYLDCVAPTTSSPDGYHLASILTVTGAMVGRRVGGYLGENQWPILHTVLVGETGLTKKDTAMNRALGAMTRTNGDLQREWFKVLSGVGSAEALADQLAGSNVLLRLSEFSGFLHKARQPATANLRPMITELWNCGPEYSLLTRGNPVRIQNPTMSLLAAIPPETLTREMGAEDIQSGFANRLLFVYGKGKPAIARPPQPDWETLGDLASEMRELITYYAPGTVLQFSRKAGDYYDEWFYSFIQETYLTELERQMAQRVPAYCVRVAILYAIAVGADRIESEHIEAGISFVLWVFRRAAPETRTWGASEDARLAAGILSLVAGPDGISRRDIDRAFGGMYGPSVVGRVIEALRNNGRIEIDQIGWARLANENQDALTRPREVSVLQ